MKKFFFVVCVLTLCIHLLNSCTKEDNHFTKIHQHENDKYDFLYEKTTVENGTLVIDAKSFFDVLKVLSGMNNDELDYWEDKIGFVSYRKKINEILEKYYNDSTLKPKELANKYPDLFYYEDSTIYPIIDNKLDQIICNTKGEYFTSDVYNKWFRDKFILVFDPDNEKIEFAKNTINTYAEKGIHVFEKSDLVDTKFKCISFYKTYRQSGRCRIYLQVDIKKMIVGIKGFPFNTKIEQYYAGWKAWGERKNWLGKWKSYSTNIRVSEAKYSVMVPIKNLIQPDPKNDAYTLTFWDSPVENVSYDNIDGCSRHYFIGDQIKTEFHKLGIPEPNFERVNVYAESRGVKPGVQIACSPW
ncbi:hypothetical protein [Tenuifilum thalassicum]|uniref:DUF4848 domain-containing protein n=1 Tax=Tenuifilum thalassicum TaxID=2590900 RepID=A0A7D4BA65_9BACT|nr:hypothetical protein [Tenuifilum thalassicum]QKG79240.1 hypothetical protein FHG85_02830 [Tenuifilum thalassicum]